MSECLLSQEVMNLTCCLSAGMLNGIESTDLHLTTQSMHMDGKADSCGIKIASEKFSSRHGKQ